VVRTADDSDGRGPGLAVVSAQHPLVVLEALRRALDGTGPAVLPRRFDADVATLDGDLLERGSAPVPSIGGILPPGTALVIETSGSTALPKRVALGRDALVASANATYRWLDAASDASGPLAARQWLLALPVEYVAGAQVLVRSIVAGTTPVVLPPGRFDPLVAAEAAESLTAARRYTSFVPAQLGRLAEAAERGDADGSRVRSAIARFDAILVGGQSTPAALRERAAALGWRIVTTYGSSETSGGCVYDGEALPGVGVRVVDGELQLSGPQLASGYVGDEVRTRAAFVVDAGTRWYRTGDAGSVEQGAGAAVGRVAGEDGAPSTSIAASANAPAHAHAPLRVRVSGRLDNVIVSGGEKVLLDRVERAARGVPGYEEAVVVPGPSAEWGQVPVLVVEERGAAAADSGAVPGGRSVEARLVPPVGLEHDVAWIAARAAAREIGRAARPAALVRIRRLPLLASGKPDRREIAALVADLLREPGSID